MVKLNYYIENSCSDEVLDYSLNKFNDNFDREIIINGLGIAFTVICLVLNLTISLCLTGLSKYCCCCLKDTSLMKSFKDKGRLEDSVDSIKNAFAKRFALLMRRRIQNKIAQAVKI